MGVMIEAKTNSGRNVSLNCYGVNKHGNYDVTLHIYGLSELHPYCIYDGYIHLDSSHDYTESEQEIIRELNMYYFAGMVDIASRITEIQRRRVIVRRKTFRELAAEFGENIRDVFLEGGLLADLFHDASRKKLCFRPRFLFRKIQWYVYKHIETLEPITSLHLGGTFQRFYKDNSWLKNAQEIKGGTIFLA